mmetsp:Transcript_11437/g.14332  ORF Transcript_11437/g.14332 Transcript_11437/m.14332 type:complete len:292 (+) Transcript_11437:84-959(+)
MEADPEMLPFNDQENPKVDGFVQQRTYSSTLSSSSSSHSSINMTAVANTPYLSTKLPRELLSCIIFCLFGMYAPSKLIYPIFGSNIRPIPYQILPNSNDVILDPSLNNPLVENVTIPSNFLIQTVITLPVFILICITYIFAPILKPKYHDTHSAVCALFTTVGMSEFTTQILKLYVGRLRPNFYALCGFDVQLLSCTNPEKMVMEGRWSFPSGHSSLSFAGMTVLTLFLLGRVGIGGSNVDISSSNNNNNNNKSFNYISNCREAQTKFRACKTKIEASDTFDCSSKEESRS